MVDDIVLVSANDWMALYIEGELVYQGHSIDSDELLRRVGVEYVRYNSFSEGYNKLIELGGRYPQSLQEAIDEGYLD